ncbi:hypothetical protein V6N12_058927 [Hibiscus sabdariffa]|uniref:Uncharacterized protein n=1 Tax=Hibiscus sabdariffa TaxID=183260 RepID=A0ABR2ETN2_9ROSI
MSKRLPCKPYFCLVLIMQGWWLIIMLWWTPWQSSTLLSYLFNYERYNAQISFPIDWSLFEALRVAYVYLDGKTRHTGLRSCYLFEKFSHQDCDGGSMAILDSLDADLSIAPGMQKLDSAGKQENSKADGSGIVWDFDRLGNLSFQLSGKKNTLIVAIDGTCAEAVGATGTSFLLNLVDPLSAAANSPISIGELVGENVDMAGELQGESLMHKTYAVCSCFCNLGSEIYG